MFNQIGVNVVVAGSAILLWLTFKYVGVLLVIILLTRKEDLKISGIVKEFISVGSKEETKRKNLYKI